MVVDGPAAFTVILMESGRPLSVIETVEANVRRGSTLADMANASFTLYSDAVIFGSTTHYALGYCAAVNARSRPTAKSSPTQSRSISMYSKGPPP